MKTSILKISFLSLLVIATLGCAHGMKMPGSVDDAVGQAQDEANAQKDSANGQLAGVQDQANGKMNDAKSQGMDQVNGLKDKAAGMVSNSAMSKAIAAEVLRRMPLIGDSKALVYANTVGQYVAQELVPSLKCRADGTTASDVRVAIVKSTTPSSFSLPGGLIFVTTALIQKMTTEDELAGVLANEMVSSICEKGVPSNLASQAASGWSDYVMTLPTKSLDRNELGFADKYALVTLYRRGYDVTPYVTFVSKYETSGRHMWGTDRAAVLKKSIAATPPIASTASARMSRFQAAKTKSI